MQWVKTRASISVPRLSGCVVIWAKRCRGDTAANGLNEEDVTAQGRHEDVPGRVVELRLCRGSPDHLRCSHRVSPMAPGTTLPSLMMRDQSSPRRRPERVYAAESADREAELASF